ncbi:hypothetical protein GCM10010252_17990 [Streptomyces aureoverticillatus]|nr:hypothetical protein GCM10010252_17990 [Streptomyces aureoverticillatus]
MPAEGSAEAAHEGLEGGGGVGRWGVRPDVADEGVHGGGAVGSESQRREECPQAGASYGQGCPLVVVRLRGAQDLVPHGIILAGGDGCVAEFPTGPRSPAPSPGTAH